MIYSLFKLCYRMEHRATLFIITSLVLTGCSIIRQQPFNILVNSLASPEAELKRTYILLPGNPGMTVDDLQFKEYAAYVTRALYAKGFLPVNYGEQPDVAIFLSYGIGNPEVVQHSYSIPIWGQTGISSSYTNGTATSYGNTTTYSGNTSFTPTYGITGFIPKTKTEIRYLKYITLNGLDYMAFKASGRQVKLWFTGIVNDGPSFDLRALFPCMIAASVPYLATNTGEIETVKIYGNETVIKEIKGE